MEQAENLKSKGIQEVACISVNDAFVMAAWGKAHGADGKVLTAFFWCDEPFLCQAVASQIVRQKLITYCFKLY